MNKVVRINDNVYFILSVQRISSYDGSNKVKYDKRTDSYETEGFKQIIIEYNDGRKIGIYYGGTDTSDSIKEHYLKLFTSFFLNNECRMITVKSKSIGKSYTVIESISRE